MAASYAHVEYKVLMVLSVHVEYEVTMAALYARVKYGATMAALYARVEYGAMMAATHAHAEYDQDTGLESLESLRVAGMRWGLMFVESAEVACLRYYVDWQRVRRALYSLRRWIEEAHVLQRTG